MASYYPDPFHFSRRCLRCPFFQLSFRCSRGIFHVWKGETSERAHPRRRKSFNLSGETRKRVIKLMIIILGRVELFGTSVKGVKRLLTERTTRPHGQRGDSSARNAVNSLVTRTNSIICVRSCHPKCCSRVMCVILIVFVANCGQQGVQESNCQCSLRIAMVYTKHWFQSVFSSQTWFWMQTCKQNPLERENMVLNTFVMEEPHLPTPNPQQTTNPSLNPAKPPSPPQMCLNTL